EQGKSAAGVNFANELGLGFPSLANMGARIEAARFLNDPVGLAGAARELAVAEKVSGKQTSITADQLNKGAVQPAKYRYQPAEMKAVAELAGTAGEELVAEAKKAEEFLAKANMEKESDVKAGITGKTRGIRGTVHVDSRVKGWIRVRINGRD